MESNEVQDLNSFFFYKSDFLNFLLIVLFHNILQYFVPLSNTLFLVHIDGNVCVPMAAYTVINMQ